jgi:hypothetical protein
MGDPRESLVSLDAPGVWEADNRVEERWQWGAQVMDLCGLSPEDYKNSTAVTVKTIQDCGECGGGGGGLSSNEGVATLSDKGKFTIVFDEPVASQVYIFGTFKDNDFEEFSFSFPVYKGTSGASFYVTSISPDAPYEITSLKIGLKEDGSDAGDRVKDKKYEYSVTYEGTIAGKTYVFSVLCTKTETLTPNDFLAIIQAKGQGFDYLGSYDEIKFGKDTSAEAVFYAICSHVDEYMPEDVEKQYFSTHSYDFIILTQEKITEIKEDFTVDTENWSNGSPVTINDSTFNKWVRRDLSGAQCPYTIGEDQCDDDDEFVFTLTITR